MSEGKIVTPVFRLSWPKLFKAVGNPEKPEQKPRFSCTMIFEDGTDMSKLEAAVEAAIKAKWGDDPPRKLRRPFNDGDEKEGAEYHGNVFINTWTTQQPKLLNRDGEEIIDPGDLYPGCLCRAIVHTYAYDQKQNGVLFTLQAIRKEGDAERFGGAGMTTDSAQKAFEEA
jgi:hypothetical protein